jgi:hypothetical protein
MSDLRQEQAVELLMRLGVKVLGVRAQTAAKEFVERDM